MLTVAFQKTIASLGRKPIMRMMGYSIGLSAVAVFLLIGLLSLIISPNDLLEWGAGQAGVTDAPSGWWYGFAHGLLQLALITMATALGLLLFPLIVPLVAGVLADNAVDNVEQEEYGLHGIPGRPLWVDIKAGLRFTFKSLGLNLLCLPLYFIPFVNMIAWVALNGTLMGREFFRMIASRTLNIEDERAAWTRHRWPYQLAGAAILLMGVVPVLNLMAPIIGIVLMTHLYQLSRDVIV